MTHAEAQEEINRLRKEVEDQEAAAIESGCFRTYLREAKVAKTKTEAALKKIKVLEGFLNNDS